MYLLDKIRNKSTFLLYSLLININMSKKIEDIRQMIEYENYANHIHCFWRTDNDFGKTAVKK